MISNILLYLFFASYPSLAYAAGVRLRTGHFPRRPRFTLLNLILLIALVSACLGEIHRARTIRRTHTSFVISPTGNADDLAREILSPAVLDATLNGPYASGGLSALPRISRIVHSREQLHEILHVQADRPSNEVIVFARAPGLSSADETVIAGTLYTSAAIMLKDSIKSFSMRTETEMPAGESSFLGSLCFGVAAGVGLVFYACWGFQLQKEARDAGLTTAARADGSGS